MTLEAIYDEHFDFVWRTVKRFGVDERSLDDAVQDVFLVVHRKLTEFEGRSKIRTWLYGISRRVASDHRRRVTRKEPLTIPLEGCVSLLPNAQQLTMQYEAASIVRTILDSLPDNQREVFVLAHLEDMSVPEIADALNVNLNTIYSRLRKARELFDAEVGRLKRREVSHG